MVFYEWVREIAGLPKTSYDQSSASLVEGIVASEALQVAKLRERILDLKLHVIDEAIRFVRSPTSDLWDRCLQNIRSALAGHELELCLRMDKSCPKTTPNTDGSSAPSGLN